MNAETRRRLEELISIRIDEHLNDEQSEELNFLLRDDPESRRFFLRYMDVHASLLSPSGDQSESEPNHWFSALQERAAMNKTSATNPKRRFRVVAVLLATAASFALAVVFYATGPSSVPYDLVRLTDSAGAEFFNERSPVIGDTLEYEREYALVDGMMTLTFPCGATVILESPSVLKIADPMRLVVTMGQCSVHAPAGAEGFRVDTPDNTIVDLGTRFSVAVDEIGTANVHVVEGAAEVSPLSANQTRSKTKRLGELQANQFRGDSVDELAFDPRGYRAALPDRIVGYEAHGRSADSELIAELDSVTVQRDGKPIRYPVESLIGVEVTHFRCSTIRRYVAAKRDGATSDFKQTLELDRSLNTGLINFGGSVSPLTSSPILDSSESATDGMAIRFVKPVENGPGPDVVLFELQSVLDPPDGDPFHVSPLSFEPGLRSHSIVRYDITTKSPAACKVEPFDLLVGSCEVKSLAELLSMNEERYHPTPLRFRAIAVGIDLSDLGYELGQTVDGLFFQDAMDDEDAVDPVFIAGLPPITNEP